MEVLRSLEKAMGLNKCTRLGLLVQYIASLDDLAYISDEELKRLVDHHVRICTRFSLHEIKPGDKNVELYERLRHELTRERELEAYERYKASKGYDKLFFPLQERVPWYEFLCRFSDVYGDLVGLDASFFDGYTVINHVSRFYDHMPQRYVPMYVIAEAGDEYTCLVTNSYKIPDALELFEFITEGSCLHYSCNEDGKERSVMFPAAEWFVLVFDQEGFVRPWTYASRVNFGMAVRPDRHEYEIYEPHQAVEIFHGMFLKCKNIIEH